ncbi:hypothetical protein [Marinobacter gelidimuriae]|uniref:hypothetical protein n=1 Tax=Marinobacter gelidimuriae TaxID=2739064 RepID=UPI0012DC0058|nr:hypothetical protein [Marinobacter gelidimuriae]
MGHYSWRCAETTQGIPLQRYELTEAIAFLPNGDRVSGFLGNYGELLRAQYVGRDNQPLSEEQNLPDGIGMGVYELIGRSLTPHVQPGPDGSMAMADIDRMQDMVKLVRVEEVEPTVTYDSLPSSVPDPGAVTITSTRNSGCWNWRSDTTPRPRRSTQPKAPMPSYNALGKSTNDQAEPVSRIHTHRSLPALVCRKLAPGRRG